MDPNAQVERVPRGKQNNATKAPKSGAITTPQKIYRQPAQDKLDKLRASLEEQEEEHEKSQFFHIGHFHFFAAYCSRQARDADSSTNELRRDLRILTRSTNKFIIAGDLNARHQDWGNARANKNGAILREDAQAGLYGVVFPFQPTFANGRHNTTLDIFLTNPWETVSMFLLR
uniref:Endo/exonuclease/phosphatase domain-containing protein n=1 Tax=Anopheles minimus TaxID=112268 RepID=A0A182VT98_9DIPT